MDNLQNFSLIDTDCIPQRDKDTELPEWYEDAASEADWADNISLHADSVAYSITGESTASLGLIDELYEKNKTLERQWKEADQKYQNLLVENQKLNIQLANERHRAHKYQKKLQYIQDNCEIFNRLKQAYLSMKYNEATGRTMVEIRERACQTWEGILCASCIQTAEQMRQMELERLCSFAGGEPDMVTVKRSDLSKLQETVQKLKDMIDEREKSWSYNAERENKYKASISELQENLAILSGVLAGKQMELETFRLQSHSTESLHKENGFLRKIVVKLEKRHRDTEKVYKIAKRPPLLNDQEKQMVQQLIHKYANKIKRSLSADANSRRGPTQSPRTSTKSSSGLDSYICTTHQCGSGEGCNLNIPSPQEALTAAPYHQEAEKPFSPKKEAVEQTDLIDFSEIPMCCVPTQN